MSFKDQDFTKRFEAMGDEAEGIFEKVFGKGFVRTGLNRPPIQMHKLPARIRYTPDYLTSQGYVEVQGFGRDQRIKLKIDKWMSLHYWNSLFPVRLFLWDTTNKRYCYVTLEQLDACFASGEASIESFPEGKPYLSFDADVVFLAATDVGEYNDATAA